MTGEDKQKSSWLEPLPEEYASDDAMTSRRMIIAAITVVVLAVFGGVIWYSYMGKTQGGPVPVVRADKAVIKEKPQDPGGMEVPNQDKLVYEKVSDSGVDAPEDRLASSPEIPLPRPAAGSPAEAAASDMNVALPPSPPGTGAAKGEETDLAAKPSAVSKTAPEKNQPGSDSVPKPSASKAASGSYMVQMGAFSKLASAEGLWKTLSQKHADVLGGLTADYMIVDLGKKGTLYRLRGGMIADRESADRICTALKGRGQSCLVVKK